MLNLIGTGRTVARPALVCCVVLAAFHCRLTSVVYASNAGISFICVEEVIFTGDFAIYIFPKEMPIPGF